MCNKVIWIINQTAGKPDSGWGERHFNLATFWVKKGYEVNIISGSYNHLFINQPNVSNKTFTIERVQEGISFCWVKTPKYFDSGFRKFWSNLIFMGKLFFFSHKKLKKPSHIIVSSMPIFPIINGYLFRKRYKSKKLIVEIRDLWPLTPIYLKGYSKKHPLIRIVAWFEKFAYQKSDEIVSLLPNAYVYIDKISKKPSKFHWIPNGIDENLLINESLPDEILKQIPKNKFIVGYAGTIGLANAMEYFIEASILLKDNTTVHFLIVGDGYLKKEFMAKTVNNTNITFIDKIDKNQVQSMLKFFNVCFVGRYNNDLYQYGVSYNKYFDYMLASKPILEASKSINSPAELANCCELVEPEDAKAIVKGIEKLQSLPVTTLNNFGSNGYHYVLKYHNFEYLSKKYLKLF